MEIETDVQQALLDHAARQTKALENINFCVMALFVASLIAVVLLLLSVF